MIVPDKMKLKSTEASSPASHLTIWPFNSCVFKNKSGDFFASHNAYTTIIWSRIFYNLVVFRGKLISFVSFLLDVARNHTRAIIHHHASPLVAPLPRIHLYHYFALLHPVPNPALAAQSHATVSDPPRPRLYHLRLVRLRSAQ